SVASEASQSSQVQKPYYPSAFGQATGPYNSAFRKPDGGPAVPGIFNHQCQSDYYIIRGKTLQTVQTNKKIANHKLN
ncbi:hypothetical protein HDU76_009352, partial [Blyttiomyces sp. JEL0837]